jgi:hypothetical protein
VEIITPRVVFQLDATTSWSWDEGRYRRIESKRDLASCATDGRVPSMQHMSPNRFAQLETLTLKDAIARLRERTIEDFITQTTGLKPGSGGSSGTGGAAQAD